MQVMVAAGFVALGHATRSHPIAAPPRLDTPLDAAIPVLPASIWAYVSWYPASVLLLLAPREQFRSSTPWIRR